MSLWKLYVFKNRTEEMLPGSVTQPRQPSLPPLKVVGTHMAGKHCLSHPLAAVPAPVCIVPVWESLLPARAEEPPPGAARGAGRSPQVGAAVLISTDELRHLRVF